LRWHAGGDHGRIAERCSVLDDAEVGARCRSAEVAHQPDRSAVLVKHRCMQLAQPASPGVGGQLHEQKTSYASALPIVHDAHRDLGTQGTVGHVASYADRRSRHGVAGTDRELVEPVQAGHPFGRLPVREVGAPPPQVSAAFSEPLECGADTLPISARQRPDRDCR
jgi:hypothetical protein